MRMKRLGLVSRFYVPGRGFVLLSERGGYFYWRLPGSGYGFTCNPLCYRGGQYVSDLDEARRLLTEELGPRR